MPLAHNREIRICFHEPRRYVDKLREFFVNSVHEITLPIPDTLQTHAGGAEELGPG